jgi:hypothetical protein
MNVSMVTKCQNASTNLDGFWFLPSQLTSPFLPLKTCHKLGVGCAHGLIGLDIFFSNLTTLIVALWTTSCHFSSSFNFLQPLSKTFSAFDGIPLGKLIFFLVGKGCAS